MPRSLHAVFAVTVIAFLVAAPWWYRHEHERNYRGFHVVEPGVLYRAGQFDLDGLKRVVRDHGIRTIVSLRDGDTALDQDEVDWAPTAGIKHFRIPPRPWWSADGSIPAEQGLAVFREVMADPGNYPVLIHCFAGIHRTGIYCAVYRMDVQGWSNHDAITEMRTMGYVTLDGECGDRDVREYLEHYKPIPPLPPANQARPLTRPPIPQ